MPPSVNSDAAPPDQRPYQLPADTGWNTSRPPSPRSSEAFVELLRFSALPPAMTTVEDGFSRRIPFHVSAAPPAATAPAWSYVWSKIATSPVPGTVRLTQLFVAPSAMVLFAFTKPTAPVGTVTITLTCCTTLVSSTAVKPAGTATAGSNAPTSAPV